MEVEGLGAWWVWEGWGFRGLLLLFGCALFGFVWSIGVGRPSFHVFKGLGFTGSPATQDQRCLSEGKMAFFYKELGSPKQAKRADSTSLREFWTRMLSKHCGGQASRMLEPGQGATTGLVPECFATHLPLITNPQKSRGWN